MDQSSTTAPPAPAGVLGRLSSLADETRTRILLQLEGSELTVSELCQVIQLPQSTVSRHLRILSQDGWLTVRSEGTRRHYRVAPSLDPGAQRLWSAVREDLARTSAAREDRIRARSVLEARAERSRAFFSTQAGRWDLLRRDLFGGRADLQLLPGLVDPDEDVGDLGCGTGQMARLLAPFCRTLAAIDRSEEMLDLARERLRGFDNVRVERGELETLPLDDGTLDVVMISLVLHYVVDPARAFGEAYRVLRPGGRILVLDMHRHDRTAFREEMGHIWLGFSRDELGTWLEEAGFEAPRIVDLPPDPEAEGPPLFTLRARRPCADRNHSTQTSTHGAD